MNNRKYKVGVYILWVGVLTILQSCYKDKGNYGYTTLNEFKVTDLKPVEVSQGDVVKMVAEVEEDKPDLGRFKYVWTLELTAEQQKKLRADSMAIIIGKEKELEYAAILPPESFVLKVDAVDKNTGIRRFTKTTLKIKGVYQKGYMLLEETSEGGDITLVNEDKVYRHVFSQNNDGQYIPLPLKSLFTANGLLDQYRRKILFVSAQGFNKELDQDDFRVRRDINDIFMSNPGKPMIPLFLHSLNGWVNMSAFIWDTGQISHVTTGSTNLLDAKYDFPFSEDYRLTPFLGYFSSSSYLGFDEKNGRFVSFDYGWASELSMNELISKPGRDGFDMDDIKEKMVYGSNIFQNRYFAGIFKDADNKHVLYELNLTSGANGPTASNRYTINPAKVPQIDRAKLFAASDVLPFLYYAVDNKLYLYDISGETAQEFLSFPVGENITTIEFANKEGTYQFGVSTWDGQQGRFYVFVPNSAGVFQLPAKYTYAGLGKIVNTHVKFNIDTPRK